MADEDAPSQTSDQYSQPGASASATTDSHGVSTSTQTNQPSAGAGANVGSEGVSAGASAGQGMNQPGGMEQSNVQNADLFFDTASAQLSDSAKSDLWKLAQWARCNPHGAIILEGHADPRGTQNYNLKLSAERAAKVRAKLLSMGVPSDRIVITVYGENGPRRGSYREDRRVTARAVTRPIPASDFAG